MIGLCPAGCMGSTQKLFREHLIPHVAVILTLATPVTLTRSPDCFSDKKLASVYPTNASVNSSYCGTFARLVSPGGGAFTNFALPGGRAFANPGTNPELLTRT